MYNIGDTVKIKKGAGDLKYTAFIYSIDETGLYVSIRLSQPIDWKNEIICWMPTFHYKYCYTVRVLLIEKKYE